MRMCTWVCKWMLVRMRRLIPCYTQEVLAQKTFVSRETTGKSVTDVAQTGCYLPRRWLLGWERTCTAEMKREAKKGQRTATPKSAKNTMFHVKHSENEHQVMTKRQIKPKWCPESYTSRSKGTKKRAKVATNDVKMSKKCGKTAKLT